MDRRIFISAAAALGANAVWGQPKDAPGRWPAKPIRIVIPAGPGGGADTIARVLAEKLSPALGQPVVPENHPGGGTILASDFVAKAPPDGYTLYMVTSSHAINAAVREGNLRYDPIRDFAPVISVGSLPDLLVVHPRVPARSVRELVELARQSPGKFTFGSAGAGSGTHLEGELFKSLAKVDLLHVPYRGGTSVVMDAIAGHVDMVFFNAIGTVGHVKAGALRALATTGARRSPLLPDVPTMEEAGVSGYVTGSWYGILMPAGTPSSIVATLNREVAVALKAPDIREKLARLGVETSPGAPDDFGAFMREDIARWKRLVAGKPELRVTD
jgi:tripartite-type tricarboxylate transporter receptor subunit TctC